MNDLRLLDLTSKSEAYAKSVNEDAKLFIETHSVTDRNTLLNKVLAMQGITRSIIENIICSDPTLQNAMNTQERQKELGVTNE